MKALHLEFEELLYAEKIMGIVILRHCGVRITTTESAIDMWKHEASTGSEDEVERGFLHQLLADMAERPVFRLGKTLQKSRVFSENPKRASEAVGRGS